MTDLINLISARFGGGFTLLYQGIPEPVDDVTDAQELAVVAFETNHPMRFLLRADFSGHGVQPSREDGWGDFTDELKVGEIDPNAPELAYCIFERQPTGFSVVGTGIILWKPPQIPITPEGGVRFDATSAPWVRVASNFYDENQASPLDQLIDCIAEALRDLGYPSFFAIVDRWFDEDQSYGYLDAKHVATIRIDDDTDVVKVLEVSLEEDQVDEGEPPTTH